MIERPRLSLSGRLIAAAAGVALLAAMAAPGRQIDFSEGWRSQGFLFKRANDYTGREARLEVASDGAVSLYWRQLPPGLWDGGAASWRWQVEASVPATDLSRKGGDDRNLALYFVFLPEDEARRLADAPVTRLLRSDSVRVLMYVWGGSAPEGRLVPSPYMDGRGATIIVRPAGTGAGEVRADLARDHARAFGTPPGMLVGLAVSADSDDTDSRIRARISDLRLSAGD